MKLELIIGVIIVLVGGWFIWGGSSEPVMEKSDAMMTEEAAMEKKSDALMQKDESTSEAMMEKKEEGTMMEKTDTMVKAGTYEAYATDKVARAETGDIVLFFRASWCPTCRAVDADIRANMGKIPATLTILDVNYDASAELKKKYGVTYQHTFVQVDAQGALIKKWSSSPTLAAVVAEVQ